MVKVSSGENKREHLKIIQGVVSRLASNQFLFKGWSVTLIAAITAFTASGNSPVFMAIPIIATLLFWAVDGYYLMLERAYRNLYNLVADKNEADIDFSMKTEKADGTFCAWFKTVWRPVLALFYGVILVVLVLLTLFINKISLEVVFHYGK